MNRLDLIARWVAAAQRNAVGTAGLAKVTAAELNDVQWLRQWVAEAADVLHRLPLTDETAPLLQRLGMWP